MGAAQASLIKLLIDAMAENGFNTLCIELEKGLRYNSHPELSASWALSIEQIKEIISCCHAKNIAVIPLVPLFSHVSYITDAHPEFIEPSSKIYCTDSKEIYKFIFEIIDEVIDIFKPRFLHIGHDEALTNYDIRERKSILTCPACSIKEPFNVLTSDIKEIHSYLKNKNIRNY
jgi:hexosaminidase